MIGLITVSNSIAVYDLSKSTIASANVISGELSPTAEEFEFLFGSALEPNAVISTGLERVSTSADTMIDCIEAVEASMLVRLVFFGVFLVFVGWGSGSHVFGGVTV